MIIIVTKKGNKMKVVNLIGVFLFILLILGCNNNPQETKGGWYIISENNEILGDAIFTKYDVDVVWIDSSYINNSMVYEVVGRFNPEATSKLSEFTEHNIGKRFGFVLNGEIITSPVIEQKNEKGGFSIISVPLFTQKSKALKTYESLFNENSY